VTRLKKQILVVLSEAQEEDLVVLINTLVKGDQSSRLMRDIIDATRQLILSGSCVMAEQRDSVTFRLVEMPVRESVSLLSQSQESITWDADRSLWVLDGEGERPEVVLTSHGVEEADRVLAEDGWIV
jgi:hypothetical protein